MMMAHALILNLKSRHFQKSIFKVKRSKIAANQLAMKLKLEPRLRREMAVIFAVISKDLRTTYSTRGTILDAKEYQDEVQQILVQHYRRAAKFFGIALRQQLVKFIQPDETKNVDDDVDDNLRKWIKETTGLRAKLIIETTQKEITGAISFAIGLQLDAGAPVNNELVASDAQKLFNERAKSRAETIAVTETQTASEGAKEIEARTVAQNAGALENLPPDQVLKKEWVAVLDSRTRTAHVLADGQRVGIDEQFIVDGERMNFPADTSFGASASNIINCRCISAVVVNNEPVASAVDTRIKPQRGKPTAAVAGVIGL